ncbi:Pol protein [Phytophthora palmivora]|uniref:Pol protein n=1 Tax=Phytophthora palmivora TaxID=4796 RepID=A0A2P4YNY0_9STRA|nr:Pol protein [Phytophthora palmivora]
MTVQNGKYSGKNYSHKPTGTAYTIDLPKSMATHPTFYVGRLKRYHDPLGLRSSAVNTPMELMSLTTKSVQVLAKDLKGPRLASLRGSLTTRSKPKGYLDRIDAISKLTDLVA